MIISTLLFSALLTAGSKASLVGSAPVQIPGPAAKFDFMNIDVKNRMVFACHPGNKSLAMMDLRTGKASNLDLKTEVNGVGIDSAKHRAFAAGPGNTLVSIDTALKKVLGTLSLSGPGDCVQYDDKRGVVYVDNDDGTNLWIVDAATLKLKHTVTIHEAPEYMEYDAKRDQIFQAIKSTNEVQVIDAKSMKVVKTWSLGELTGPHGLCLDSKMGRVYVAGKNGKLVVLNADSGAMISTFNVGKGSDQIALDASMHRLYIPAESKLQVIDVTSDAPKMIAEPAIAKDCKRVTVDTVTHDVWIAFVEGSGSYFQRFTQSK